MCSEHQSVTGGGVVSPLLEAPASAPLVGATMRSASPAPQAADGSCAEDEDWVDDEDTAVATFFASEPPPAPDAWVDLTGQHAALDLDPAHQLARRITGYMVPGALVLLAGFLLYNKVLMPTPVTLGQGTVALPTPQVMQPSADAPSDQLDAVAAELHVEL